jgi:hypothetical protein
MTRSQRTVSATMKTKTISSPAWFGNVRTRGPILKDSCYIFSMIQARSGSYFSSCSSYRDAGAEPILRFSRQGRLTEIYGRNAYFDGCLNREKMCMGCCTLTELNYHNGVHVGNRFVTTSFSISLSRKNCVDPHLLIVLVLRVGISVRRRQETKLRTDPRISPV